MKQQLDQSTAEGADERFRSPALAPGRGRTVSDQPDEMPFGFETRVLADWRAGLARDFVDVGASSAALSSSRWR